MPANANPYEKLMERSSELRTVLVVMCNMFIKLANQREYVARALG
jgi:hypothetical protein